MSFSEITNGFFLGSHLCREPMPAISELKHDMGILSGKGFNIVKLQEHWAFNEPAEGKYDFSKYEQLIEHAAGLGLGVYLALTCEQAPPWLYRKYPDCRMVGTDNVPIAYEATTTLPADGKPGPCWDHPGAMADKQRFIREFVRVLGKYENVLVWNTWQEVAYASEPLVGQMVCYCSNTLARYTDWLKTKYRGIDGLNRAWKTAHVDWDSVAPDRANGKICVAQHIDWRFFMNNVQISNVLAARAEAIKSADPSGRPIFAHVCMPALGSGREWIYARCQDHLGMSCYPAWFPAREWDDLRPVPGEDFDKAGTLVAEMWSAPAMNLDYIRSANRRSAAVWAAEFQGGPVSDGLHKGRVPSPSDIRRWMLTAIGSGATAISFWVTRAEIMAEEMNGFSLLDSTGEETVRLNEAGRVGAALRAHPELFGENNLERAPVAILVNEENYRLCDSMAGAVEQLEYSARGWHRLLWDQGIPVDFLDLAHWEEADVSDYQLLVLPFPLAMSDASLERIAAYVSEGGNLVSEACVGRLDEHAFARRGEIAPRARELFGASHRSLQMVREPNREQRWTAPEYTWGEYADSALLEGVGPMEGEKVLANFYIETFLCESAEQILSHRGNAAGCMNRFDRGSAILLGTLVGHNGTAYRDSPTASAVRRLLAMLEVHPGHNGRLLLRRRMAGAREAWIVTNPTADTVRESFDVSGYACVSDLLGPAPDRLDDSLSLSVDPFDVRVLFLETR